jgi:hypothetical protein
MNKMDNSKDDRTIVDIMSKFNDLIFSLPDNDDLDEINKYVKIYQDEVRESYKAGKQLPKIIVGTIPRVNAQGEIENEVITTERIPVTYKAT